MRRAERMAQKAGVVNVRVVRLSTQRAVPSCVFGSDRRAQNAQALDVHREELSMTHQINDTLASVRSPRFIEGVLADESIG